MNEIKSNIFNFEKNVIFYNIINKNILLQIFKKESSDKLSNTKENQFKRRTSQIKTSKDIKDSSSIKKYSNDFGINSNKKFVEEDDERVNDFYATPQKVSTKFVRNRQESFDITNSNSIFNNLKNKSERKETFICKNPNNHASANNIHQRHQRSNSMKVIY